MSDFRGLELLGLNFASVLLMATSIAGAQNLALEEVIVTAQKREQSILEVPIPVTAITAAQIKEAGILSIQNIATLAPVLEVQSNIGAATTNYRIRRVGNLGNLPTFEPSVGLFIDGAFRQHSVFGATELLDIKRVEILRGPQNTLYGKNTSAGVISILTQPPSSEFESQAEFLVGRLDGAINNSLANISARISGPLTGTLRGRLAVNYAYSGGWMKLAVPGGEEANNNERLSARGQLAWEMTDHLDMRLIASVVEQGRISQSSADLYFHPDGMLAHAVLPMWQSVGVSTECGNAIPHDRHSCLLRPIESELETADATLLTNYNFKNGTRLSLITSWDTMKSKIYGEDVAQMMAPLLRGTFTWKNRSIQQEVRLSSAENDSEFNWLVGAFFFHQAFSRGDNGDTATFAWDIFSDHPAVSSFNQTLLGTPFPLPLAVQGQEGFLDSKLDTTYSALFGQASWKLTDHFQLIGGMRWQEEEKTGYFRQSVNDPSPSILSLLLSPSTFGSENLARQSNNTTGSLTFQWRLSDRTMFYGTTSNGWKSGGFNTGSGAMPVKAREFRDEESLSYELGAKTRIWDGRTSLSAAVFNTEFDSYQDAAFVGGQFTIGNAAKAKVSGIELEASALLSDRLTLDASVSYADFIYVENTNGLCYPGRAPDSPSDPTACDLSGEHPINAPEWKTHLAISHEKPMKWGLISTRLDWAWTDNYQTSFSSDPRLIQDAYSLINFRIGVRRNQLEATFWIKNALNETVSNLDAVVNIYALPTDGSFQSYLQPPRSYGVTFRKTF